MATDDADDLVPFQDVRVLRSTAPALLCRIGERSVWLPRGHISGRLWCAGDRGKLYVRRWVARERHLILPNAIAVSPPAPRPPRPGGGLRLVRGGRSAGDAS